MEAWRTLLAKVEKFFPGYEWAGYDPDLVFKEKGQKDYSWMQDRFTLSLKAALALVEDR